MEPDKRRSDRLLLTIPLHVSGVDRQGNEFKENARTITLNRHGARIALARLLVGGQIVRLTNLVIHREANFRVVGPITPYSPKGGEWGVECIDGQKDIWGIQFPPPPAGQQAESAALLECRRCHTVALMRTSLVEIEVLGTAGLLSKPCETCKTITLWGQAEKQVAMNAPPDEAAMLAAVGAPSAMARGIDLRRHRRVALQLPVLIRDYSGDFEITKSENVSKGGFCFASEKSFLIGEGVMVACPYSGASNQNLEVSAKIVRRQSIEGTNRKIYGVRYDKQTS
ncbi:MAG: PilZ domain-containing protein [Terriglobia bacterium]|jgi:hypothetical protein